MSLNRNMLRTVVSLLGQHRVRTPYSILGATLAGLGTNQTFSPQDFGPAVGSMLRSIYGRSHPEASWIVSARTGFPSGYRPGPDFAE